MAHPGLSQFAHRAAAVGRVAGFVVGGLFALVLAAVALVLIALAIPPLRALAVDEGLEYANQHLDGMRVELKSVDRLDLWGVNLRGVRLLDAQERELVNVRWVLVRLNPFSLVHKTLALTRVEVDGVRARLYPAEEEAPAQEEPAASDEPSTFTIRVAELRIRGAELTTPWSGRHLRAAIGTLSASGQWGAKPALALREATIEVTADDALLLRLHTTEGDFRAEHGGRFGVAGTLAGAPLTLKAEVPALSELEPWPIRSASLRLRRLDRRALELLGVADGAELERPLDLALDARTRGDRLEAEAQIAAGPDQLALTASAAPDAYDAHVRISPMRLQAIAGSLPDLKVEGQLHLRATPGDGTPERIGLEWSGVAIDDGAIPNGLVRAELALPIVRLTRLSLDGMERALALRGEYDTARSAGKLALDLREFELHAIEWLQKQGIAGVLEGGLSLSGNADTVQGRGEIALKGFRHPSARFAELELGFGLSGPTRSPEGQLTLRAQQLTAGELQLDRVSAEARATARALTGRLQVRGPETLLNVELGGQRSPDGGLRAQAIGRGKLAQKELRFDLRELLYDQQGLSVEELSLYSGKQALHANGSLDARDRLRAELKLASIDLGEWASVAGVSGVAGQLDARIKAEGTRAAPRVEAELNFANAQYQGQQPLNALIALKADLGRRRAEAQLTMYSDEELGARGNLSVALPKRPISLANAAPLAHVKAQLSAYLPVAQISALAGDQLAGLAGTLEAQLKAEGTLDAPDVDLDMTAALKLPERTGEPLEALHVGARLDKDEGELTFSAKDELGQLLTLTGQFAWPGGSPRAALERPEQWQKTRFKAQAELSPRRFDTMQGVFAYFSKLYAHELPIRAGGRVSLEGQEGNLDGAAQLKLVVFGDKLDGRCQLGARSAVDLEAKLQHDRVEVALDARTDGGGKLRGELDARLALDARPGEPAFGPAKLSLSGKEIAIHRLPGLCNLAGGWASFSVSAEGLGQRRPELDLNATIRDLQAHDAPALSVETKAHAGGDRAELSAQLKSKQRSVGTIAARVPLSYPDGITPTVLPTAPLQGRVQLDRLPLADLLSFTEALGRTSGTANADISVSGPLQNPSPVGYIELDRVNLSIAAIAQPLRDLNARIEVKGRSVKLPELTARDRDGTIKLEGYANLREDLSGEGGVYLEAHKFPLRQQGTVIGELDTRARFDMKIPSDLKAEAELKIVDGEIWLTGERGKSVQTLDPHPDVRFADEKTERASTESEQKAQGQGFTLASFRMKTEHDLWLNHNDFSIQVGVELALLEGGEAGPRLEGEASLRRGEIKLLGKPFRLEKGAIRFTGDMPPDPELDIKATYKPPTGADLVVQVSGRGSAPVLEFSGAATTAGEAVAVLTGVGASNQSQSGAESQASGDMKSLAANMAAGLLVMSARREFGEWVPMISVEAGDSVQSSTARAGFDASRLIPPWLQGFARSAYVEGIVGSAGSSGGGGRAGLGVKLEVALPQDFVTTLNYGPVPGSWSTDLAWSP